MNNNPTDTFSEFESDWGHELAKSLEILKVFITKKDHKKPHNPLPPPATVSAIDIQPVYQKDLSIQSIIADARWRQKTKVAALAYRSR